MEDKNRVTEQREWKIVTVNGQLRRIQLNGEEEDLGNWDLCDKKVIREKNEGVAEVLRRVGERDKFLWGVNIRKFAVSFKETQFLKRYVNLKE